MVLVSFKFRESVMMHSAHCLFDLPGIHKNIFMNNQDILIEHSTAWKSRIITILCAQVCGYYSIRQHWYTDDTPSV